MRLRHRDRHRAVLVVRRPQLLRPVERDRVAVTADRVTALRVLILGIGHVVAPVGDSDDTEGAHCKHPNYSKELLHASPLLVYAGGRTNVQAKHPLALTGTP